MGNEKTDIEIFEEEKEKIEKAIGERITWGENKNGK